MNKPLKTTLYLIIIMATSWMTNAQGMKMGEVIIISGSSLKKDVKPEAFQTWISNEIAPSWNKNKEGISFHLFRADRGDRKGDYLLVCGTTNLGTRKILEAGNPFNEKFFSPKDSKSGSLSDFLNNSDSYTEYHIIGGEKVKPFPIAGILGIHYIKVKPERSTEFEKFVDEKMHPAVGHLLPDMQLLYYKAVAGENAGEYITIFAIKSVAARNKYWPEGAPETEILKQTFMPLKQLAIELGSYLVEGSYLGPESGGAAAYFESHNWTDFIELD